MHPLVASAVFHYEFEFIHPFADGNGRVGRLWQTLILTSWNPLFAVPVESMIHAHQQEYYVAINASTNRADCAPFIEFILQTILETLEISQDTTEVGAEVATEVKRLLAFCQGEQSKVELRQLLGLKNDEHFRKAYIKPALEFGVLEMTIPNKPNSRLQKYRLTPLGCRIKENRAG
ncbi:MAG: Fic family protein [Kiritimatiellales bacterium]|nr:Fic family protein [Kiritimatiellales bacterium]